MTTKLLGSTFHLLNSTYLLCLIKSIALILKVSLITALGWGYYSSNPRIKNMNFYHIILTSSVIFCSLIGDFYWQTITLNNIKFLYLSDDTQVLLARITWISNIIFHLLTSLLIENLLQRYAYRSSIYHFLRMSLGVALTLFFISIAFLFPHTRLSLEVLASQSIYFYVMIINFQTVFQVIRTIRQPTIPKLLRHQLKIFVFALLTPHLLLKLLTANPLEFSPSYIIHNYAFMTLTTAIFTYAMYFCAKKLIGLRFLNVKQHVETPTNFNFIKDFKSTLEQLGKASETTELKHITQQFFKEAFNMNAHNIHLHIRGKEHNDELSESQKYAVENSVGSNDSPVADFVKRYKILIKDEIEFSYFYNQEPEYKEALNFLQALDAGIFLPIYNGNTLTSYIIVDSSARPKGFYNSNERDEMLVFVAYVSSIINLLQHRNLNTLLAQEKDLKEELYAKHQEINQYKESIRSFLKNANDRKIGIIFYKYRKFIVGNQAAQALIDCDPNTQHGHPVAHALRNLAKQAQQYNSTQSVTIEKDIDKKLVLTAMPGPEHHAVTVTVHYPEIADTVKLQSDLLKDPSHWDYLLYLETTESGQLINRLIPGHGETLLNFKIELLKIALSRKATLLSMPPEDLETTVDILHTISLRKTFHTIKLSTPESEHAIAIKLFGLNPLLAGTQQLNPLLEELDNTGTLFIKNIHFLSMETQEYLSEFIRYGMFRKFKSEHKTSCNVRIICSSDRNLSELVEENLFSRKLFHELRKTSLEMPRLADLSKEEFNALVDSLARQLIQAKPLEQLFTLSGKEKSSLANQRPISIQQLKERIYHLLNKKSERDNLDDIIQLTPAHVGDDSELTYALSLGKEALKDRKVMQFLWKRFKSQSKIATLLGVNRSSISRRFKEYQLS